MNKRCPVNLLMYLLVFVGLSSLFFLFGCAQVHNCPEQVAQYTSLIVSPEVVSVSLGNYQQFSVNGLISASSTSSNIEWAVSGSIGTIDATGLFLATTEGVGLIEARAGSLVGKATVEVTAATGRTITGNIINLGDNTSIPLALVLCGNKTTSANNQGSYTIRGITSDADVISAAAINHTACSKQLLGDQTDISLTPSNYSYGGSDLVDYAVVKGRILDGSLNPIVALSDGQLQINMPNSSYGAPLSDPNGRFSITVSALQNASVINGYISIIYKKAAGDYRAICKEITVTKGVTCDVGDIIVNDPAAIISGTISVPSEFALWSIDFGINNLGVRRTITSIWSSGYEYLWGRRDGNSYTLRLPATPSGLKSFISVMARTGMYSGDVIYKYVDDQNYASGSSYPIDVALPQGITINSPYCGQTGVSTAPKIEWSALDGDWVYSVYLGNQYGAKWIGYTMNNSINFPQFPVGSVGEIVNLIPGQEYYLMIYANKCPGLVPTDFINILAGNVSEVIYKMPIPFTVGATTTSNSIKSSRNREEFEKQVKSILRARGQYILD